MLDDTFIQYDDKRLERTIKYLIKKDLSNI